MEVLRGGFGESDGHGSALFASFSDVNLLIFGLEMMLEIGLECWRPVSILRAIWPDTVVDEWGYRPSLSAAHIYRRRLRAFPVTLFGHQLLP